MAPAEPTAVWSLDPDDPRAPPAAVWDAMSPTERARVLATLPSDFPLSETNPPEGDFHFNAKKRTRDVLDGFFKRVGRRVYLACELPTYYPGERMFAPDVFAVLDAERHERAHWVVAEEGKGLDVAFEIVVSGNRRKDLRVNVERYERLGIAEYFVFDRARLRLFGYRLPTNDARVYEPMLAQGGRFASRVLGLDLRIQGERLRFSVGSSPVLEADEIIESLETMVDETERRLAAAEERAEEEGRLRAEEARLRAETERRLADALAEFGRAPPKG